MEEKNEAKDIRTPEEDADILSLIEGDINSGICFFPKEPEAESKRQKRINSEYIARQVRDSYNTF